MLGRRVRKAMKARSESLLRLALIVCLANGGCASRTHSQVVASPPAPSRAPQPVNASVAVSEPPATAALPDENAFNCGLISERADAVSSVALVDRIDPANAPHPSNESERLLF